MKRSFFPMTAMMAAASLMVTGAAQAGPPGTGSPTGQQAQALQQLPKVEGAWVRSAVRGQQGTGGFMKLTARKATQLVRVTTPVAGAAEVHEMKMEGDVMRMRAVPRLDLPAGTTVELKPGGYHLMLLDLKQPLQAGSSVPLTLTFRDATGAESQLELRVPVATRAPGTASPTPAAAHKQ